MQDFLEILFLAYKKLSAQNIILVLLLRLAVGTYPSTKWVKQTNKAIISVQVDSRTGRIVLMCVIDNLIKGQAGQGIQNLNIMAGLDESTGIPLGTYYP